MQPQPQHTPTQSHPTATLNTPSHHTTIHNRLETNILQPHWNHMADFITTTVTKHQQQQLLHQTPPTNLDHHTPGVAPTQHPLTSCQRSSIRMTTTTNHHHPNILQSKPRPNTTNSTQQPHHWGHHAQTNQIYMTMDPPQPQSHTSTQQSSTTVSTTPHRWHPIILSTPDKPTTTTNLQQEPT